MNTGRVEQIREKLTAAFAPQQLDIIDDSHKHVGHEGAKSGGGHFNITIVADAFAGQTPLQRHRLVYTALGEELKKDIHALSIKALAPMEL